MANADVDEMVELQWNRILLATLDFVNDIRTTMGLPVLTQLPRPTHSKSTFALALPDCHRGWCWISAPRAKLDHSKLPDSLKKRTCLVLEDGKIINFVASPNKTVKSVEIDIPDIVSLFTKVEEKFRNGRGFTDKPIKPLLEWTKGLTKQAVGIP